jgi:autophagy-related protein 16-1
VARLTVIPDRAKRNFVGHKGEINSVAWNHAGTIFATGSNDKNVTVWEGHTGALKGSLTGAVQSVMCVRFSGNDELLLGASNDNATRVWSVNSTRLKVCALCIHEQ